ncbi:MAG: uroporphyrinogen decarboxylase, partial [Betaproteobacteria bacterium]|nr:uroporphyrinogen decarboxylase [Betaproteobacteria bacterium]
KGGGLWLESMADSGADALGLDWTVPIAEAKRRVGHRVALQGNLDPAILFADLPAIERAATKIITDFRSDGGRTGHVFNLGHGISQFTQPDHVKALVHAVHRASA